MTYADAAELVLRETQRAMKPAELWAEIERRGLVETAGVTPVATLIVSMLRRAANSSVSRSTAGEPRFYRDGNGAFGLWAGLSPEQQRAVRQSGAAPARTFTMREFRSDRTGMREKPEVTHEVLARTMPDEGPRRAVAHLMSTAVLGLDRPGLFARLARLPKSRSFMLFGQTLLNTGECLVLTTIASWPRGISQNGPDQGELALIGAFNAAARSLLGQPDAAPLR